MVETSLAADELPFEEALQRLEAVIESMEAGDLPLETLIKRYEEGTHLARLCQAKLSQAELKIQKLEQTAEGQWSAQPLASDAESAVT